MFERHVEPVSDYIDEGELNEANSAFRDVERFWMQQLGFETRVAEFLRAKTAA